MGRHKKTKEEKDEKRRLRQKRYYERWKEKICKRNMDYYWKTKKMEICKRV